MITPLAQPVPLAVLAEALIGHAGAGERGQRRLDRLALGVQPLGNRVAAEGMKPLSAMSARWRSDQVALMAGIIGSG